MTHEMRKLQGRIEALRGATMFEQAQMAQAVLDETLSVLKCQEKRIGVLEAQINSLHISTKGARNHEPA